MKMYSEQGLLVLEDSEKMSSKQIALYEVFNRRVKAAAKDFLFTHEVKDGMSVAKRVLGKECTRISKEQDKLRQDHLRLLHFINSLEKEMDENSPEEETKEVANEEVLDEETGVVMITLPIPLAIIKAIHDDLCK